MQCPQCGHQFTASPWAHAVVRVSTILAIIVAYQITLTFFVARYDIDELRNLLLLVVNIAVILGAKNGVKHARDWLTKQPAA